MRGRGGVARDGHPYRRDRFRDTPTHAMGRPGGAVIGRQATVIHGAIGAATDRGRDGRITTMRCLARF